MMKCFQKSVLAIFLILLPVVSEADNAVVLHEIQVRLDPERHILVGEARITLPPGQSRSVRTDGITVKAVSSLGAALTADVKSRTMMIDAGSGPRVVSIDFEVSYAPARASGREDGIEQANVVEREGIVLTGSWYPAVEGLSAYRLKALLPAGFEGISEADDVLVKEQSDGSREFAFVFNHPVEEISLIAGKYHVRTVRHEGIDIVTFFFPEEEELAETYLEYTKKYLDIYSRLIGPYPFKRFAVVENILPTGYSMPTFTLLGRDVIKLPFIVETSLGHEILHQWFGNSVYIDHASGNWAEGLTTYLADHQYEEMKGEGWEYRKQVLLSYRNYIVPENDFSLKNFISRSDRATAAVGYGKTAMVFHMLKQELGADAFDRALREFYIKNRFSRASWSDIQKSCEDASGTDLGWFFKQWIEGRGAVDFQIKDAMITYEGTQARISFDVEQKERKDRFLLPVVLRTDKGEIRKTFRVEKGSASFEIETGELPLELVVDRDYDLFRTLSDGETMPVISAILGSRDRIFVIPRGKEQEYAGLSGFLKTSGFVEKKEEEVTYDDIKNSSLLVPGDCELMRRLFGQVALPEGDFSLVTRFSPYSNKNCIGIISSVSVRDMQDYLQRITHYGKYTTVIFTDGRNVTKSTEAGERGIGIALSQDVRGVSVPRLEPLSQIIEAVSGKDIIYVGEFHDRFENHRVQLQVIRELYRKNKNLAIGMEMFQKPFQGVLDEYIAGTIDEKTFLKRSEYYKRWAFDYHLYREILLFARENRIPVIALNIKKEIVTKVSKGGLLALGAEDLKEVPRDIDLSDTEYRERLRESYAAHANPENRNFDFFYQSQVLWDESMAHNLSGFMTKNPGHQVVVLAGSGHMVFGSGIPKRTYRLNRKEYAVILNAEDMDSGIADYVLFPAPVPFRETPKLGVQLKEVSGVITVTMVAPESAAEKAGIRKNDAIISLDGEKMEAVEDLKIHLLSKKKGDTLVLRVLRKRFLFGPKEIDLSVTL